MKSLPELQKQFAAALKSQDESIISCIESSARLLAADHMAIYQSSSQGALQNVLKEIYPVCHELVGTEFFILMINEYIAITPSQSPNLGDYGENFANFITGFPPANSLPYLADVARLEWAWHRIFEAPDSIGLDIIKLSACYETAGDAIIFFLPQGCFLLSSRYPVDRIWETNQKNYRGDKTIRLNDNQSFYFLIWRNGLEMRIDALNEFEWHLLNWIHAELSLGAICELIDERFPHVAFDEVLPQLVTRGWLDDFSTDQDR